MAWTEEGRLLLEYRSLSDEALRQGQTEDQVLLDLIARYPDRQVMSLGRPSITDFARGEPPLPPWKL